MDESIQWDLRLSLSWSQRKCSKNCGRKMLDGTTNSLKILACNGMHSLKDWRISKKIKIPRYTQGGGSSETKELHLFGDASEAAIGAAAYIVTEKEGTRTSHLLCAKSRVTPLEKQTLPRLELASSLLADTLGDYIIQSTPGYNFERICCSSDSTSALGQIKCDLNKREKWVYNRSLSIRKLTNPE